MRQNCGLNGVRSPGTEGSRDVADSLVGVTCSHSGLWRSWHSRPCPRRPLPSL